MQIQLCCIHMMSKSVCSEYNRPVTMQRFRVSSERQQAYGHSLIQKKLNYFSKMMQLQNLNGLYFRGAQHCCKMVELDGH